MSLIQELVNKAVQSQPLSDIEKQYCESLQKKYDKAKDYLDSFLPIEKYNTNYNSNYRSLVDELSVVKNNLISLKLREQSYSLLDKEKIISFDLVTFRITSPKTKGNGNDAAQFSYPNNGEYSRDPFENRRKKDFTVIFTKIIPRFTKEQINKLSDAYDINSIYIICQVLDYQKDIVSNEMILSYYHDNKFWLIDVFNALSYEEVKAQLF